jgi:hypothetical protein
MNSYPEAKPTLDVAYEQYIQQFPGKAACLKTTILHYLLPYDGFGFDLQVKPGEQLRGEKSKQVWELTQKVKLEDLGEIERVLTWQAAVFDRFNASRGVRRPNKHYLKHFLEWCKDQGYLGQNLSDVWEVPQSLPSTSKAYHRRGGRERQLIFNRRPLIEYSADVALLSEEIKSQLAEFTSFWTNENYKGTRPIQKTIRKSTDEGCIRRILHLIGWYTLDKLEYHRQMCERARLKQKKDPSYESGWLAVDPEPPDWLKEMQEKYPPRPTDRFMLEELIPVVEIRPEMLVIEEFNTVEPKDNVNLLKAIQDELKAQNALLSFDTIILIGQVLQRNQSADQEIKKLNRITAKADAEDQAKIAMNEAGKQVRNLLKSFFEWLQYQHNPTESPDGYRIAPSYRASFCHGLMNLAKFFYRDITNSRDSPDYEDIGIIMEIRLVQKGESNSKFKPNSVSSIKRNPTWKELGGLLKELLVACAPRRKIESETEYRSMGPLRRQTAVARDFQKYLVMMFFRVISPDRQHVVRELEQHNTLKLCWINRELGGYEEAPWDKNNKRYEAYYNPHTKLYYLDIRDVTDKGAVVKNPQGKAFAWVVFLDATQTKIDQENAYRVPKIYNPELETWINGREDYSGTWFNWPKQENVVRNKWKQEQYHWCGYIDTKSGKKAGFRDTFKPSHNFIFTQENGTPFTASNMCRFYDAILWRHLGIRSNPHAARSAATGHFKLKGMTEAESESLAQLKSHSVKMQNSSAYNKLAALDKTARASEMIVKEFLEENGLDPDEYGFAQ